MGGGDGRQTEREKGRGAAAGRRDLSLCLCLGLSLSVCRYLGAARGGARGRRDPMRARAALSQGRRRWLAAWPLLQACLARGRWARRLFLCRLPWVVAPPPSLLQIMIDRAHGSRHGRSLLFAPASVERLPHSGPHAPAEAATAPPARRTRTSSDGRRRRRLAVARFDASSCSLSPSPARFKHETTSPDPPTNNTDPPESVSPPRERRAANRAAFQETDETASPSLNSR